MYSISDKSAISRIKTKKLRTSSSTILMIKSYNSIICQDYNFKG